MAKIASRQWFTQESITWSQHSNGITRSVDIASRLKPVLTASKFYEGARLIVACLHQSSVWRTSWYSTPQSPENNSNKATGKKRVKYTFIWLANNNIKPWHKTYAKLKRSSRAIQCKNNQAIWTYRIGDSHGQSWVKLIELNQFSLVLQGGTSKV